MKDNDPELRKIRPHLGFLSGKESAANAGDSDPWDGKIPWKSKWQPIPIVLPGNSQGKRSLVGYSPCTLSYLDTTEWLNTAHRPRLDIEFIYCMSTVHRFAKNSTGLRWLSPHACDQIQSTSNNSSNNCLFLTWKREKRSSDKWYREKMGS